MKIEGFITKIKKGETPFYRALNRAARRCMRMEARYIPALHRFLYWERRMRIAAWRNYFRVFYYQPLFRSRCASCGKDLHIYHSGQGLPMIEGDIVITIGDNVRMHDRTTIIALAVGGASRLTIGNDNDIPSPISMFIGNEVIIGSNCIVAGTLIADNPGHSLDYLERRGNRVGPDMIGRVVIGDDVWVGQRSMIIGNVTVGTGAVIGARAIVKKDVPPFCVVAGVPARIIRKLPFPDELVEALGEEQYRAYLDARIGS